MKKLLVLFATTLFILGSSTAAMALTFDYTHDASPDVRIDNDSNVPNSANWYRLLLPSWYDSNQITAFSMDLYGRGDDSTSPIDIWGKLGSSSAQKIVGYDVRNSYRDFVLRMDIVSGDLYGNYQNADLTWTGFLDTNINLSSWPALSDFDGLSSFLIGYACHYYYDMTSLHIEQTPVPEPATMLLLGSGLIGLAGFGRKKLFKK